MQGNVAKPLNLGGILGVATTPWQPSSDGRATWSVAQSTERRRPSPAAADW